MDRETFKAQLNSRRSELGITYKTIQERTGLGYNTVRRTFNDPWKSQAHTLLLVIRTLGCELVFAIEDKIGDELEI